MQERFDLIVVGGGSAGFAAAIKGVELGARVALIEGGTLGGTCVNVGCVPSKTLIRAAEAQYQRAHHEFAGVPTGNGPVRWDLIRGQKDELVGAMRQAKYRDVLRAYSGIRLFPLRATVSHGGSVTLEDGRQLAAGKLLIATGASPWAAPIPGLAEAGSLDSTSAMAMASLPESLAVLGGSAVGLELGQMFARLGVRVTVLEAQDRLVPSEDPAIGEALAGYLRNEGVEVHTGITPARVVRAGRYIVSFRDTSGAGQASADQLLVATGRRANSGGLGLEASGVGLGQRGEVLVNEYLQTGNPDIYAAGDVIGDPMFVYVAAYAGATAAENALSGNRRRYDLSAVPRVTFTDPAIAAVGLMAHQASRDIELVVRRLSLEHVPRAQAAHDTRGFVQLVAEAKTRRLAGAHILAAEAGEMIAEPALAIRHGLTIDDITAAQHPYLTLSEGIKLAALSFTRDVGKLSCCAV